MVSRSAVISMLLILLAGCRSTTPSAQAPGNERTASQSARKGDWSFDQDREGGRRQDRRRSRRARPATNAAPGDFDFYLFTLSWSPEYCSTHPGSPECGAHPGFVVHGLWPQNGDGTYPENCSGDAGPSDPQQYTNLIPTASLVQHEWKTHGTCSGLTPDAYFAKVGTAYRAVKIPPSLVNPSVQLALTPSAIIGEFSAANPGFPQGSIALSCGNNYLTAVEVCLTKSLIPEACQNVRTCGATSVKITPRS